MAKLMAPNIRIDWYPEGHFQDVRNPTIEELNSGVNLSCAIVTGYTLDFTDSNTEDVTTIFDNFTSESILSHSYEADLQFFLAPRGSNADNEAAYRKAEELFYHAENRVGYLAKRFGFHWEKPYDFEQPRQRVDLFKVKADLPKVLSEDDGPILLNVRYIPQGEAASGATAGRIRYEWEGEPHNSPSVKILGDHNYSYVWAGVENNSESIMYQDGIELVRNHFTNPSFESSDVAFDYTQNLASYGTKQITDAPTGSNVFSIQAREDSRDHAFYRFSPLFAGPTVKTMWVAVSATVRLMQPDSGFQIRAQYTTNSTTYISLQRVTNQHWKNVVFGAFEVPTAATNVSLSVYINNGTNLSNAAPPNAEAQIDNLHVVSCDTEVDALHYVKNYFDGNTPDHSGEIISRNLLPNPSFETGTHGVNRSNSEVSLVPKNDRLSWINSGKQMLRIDTNNPTTTSYIGQYHYGASPGKWYAFRASVESTSNDPTIRGFIQFRAGSSTLSNAVLEDTNPPKGGRDYIFAAQAPENTDRILALVWPTAFDGTYFVDGMMLAEGNTEEEALAQVQEYFDGDTVDK